MWQLSKFSSEEIYLIFIEISLDLKPIISQSVPLLYEKFELLRSELLEVQKKLSDLDIAQWHKTTATFHPAAKLLGLGIPNKTNVINLYIFWKKW